MWNRGRAVICRCKTGRMPFVLLLLLHAALLTWCAVRHSYCWTESGLLPSGVTDWQFGDFAAYRVNPPLIRMWATLPLMATDIDIPYYGAGLDPRHCVEWDLAAAMFEKYGTRTWAWLTIGRIMCIPFCLLGMAVAVRWSHDLFGREAALGTAVLWTFSPWMLGYGCLISGDAQAASMGVVVLCVFRQWMKDVSLATSWILGVCVGIAVLTKFSWLIFFVLLPLMVVLIRCGHCLGHRHKNGQWPSWHWPVVFRHAGLTVFAFAICLLVINLGYGFKGSFRGLGDFEFISKALAGAENWQPDFFSGNRFRDGWLGLIPVPFPEDMIIGLDLQKWDFDRERWSYLLGKWQNTGWWYYYLFGLTVKTPVTSLLLLLIAVLGAITQKSWRESWADALILGLPVAVILLLASMETGLNRHTRYVLPVVPLLIIFCSRAVLACRSQFLAARWLVAGCLIGSVSSSLWIFPNSHSYFNEFVGGPRHAHHYMNASNLDWGQDLKAVHLWCERYPEKRPVFVSSYPHVPAPGHMQIPSSGGVPNMPMAATSFRPIDVFTKRCTPGWYVIDSESLIRQQGDYQYLEQLSVDEYIGTAFRVYHVTEETVEQLQRHGHEEGRILP